jgi:YkoY family integral membrane protein
MFDATILIATLVGLEVILSADNAIVLGALANGLPEHQRRRALFYGIMGAFILRGLAIFSAAWIIQFWFLQVLGGGYLIWLGMSNLTSPGHGEADSAQVSRKQRGFWGTVLVIELTDLAFAVDSVLAAVALTSNMWIIYAGAVIGLIAMRFAAVGVLRLLEKFPEMNIYAYVLVSWIGVKLTLQGIYNKGWFVEQVHMTHGIFWTVMFLIMGSAFLHWWRKTRLAAAQQV